MGTVKGFSVFRHKGKAFNILVKDTNDYNIMKNFFDGIVHPDYPVYNNDSGVVKISDVSRMDIVIDRDNSTWIVEDLLEYEVDEDFYDIELTDGRHLKCSQKHRILITSPKKIVASEIRFGDIIADVSIGSVGKYVRPTPRRK